jgi:hypothetical protein
VVVDPGDRRRNKSTKQRGENRIAAAISFQIEAKYNLSHKKRILKKIENDHQSKT